MAAIPGLDLSKVTYIARLATFTTEHQLTKRRASSQKKKQPTTASWPHQSPSAEDLARAGFFFNPAPDSDDNVQCFHCAVKLDGWESEDVPLKEHLAHSTQCSYAISLSVFDKAEDRDPMSPELVEARRNTFADMWPHENKKAWKPKVKQMIEAGWAYDPSPDDEDGATCFYCNMSLDGWEPKDSPLEEHRRREPNCPFFALVDRYKSTRPKAARGRASTASKASRLSTQSMQSTFSEAPSLMSLGDAGPSLEIEESLAMDTTISSDTGKGRKKTAKGRKKTTRQESVEPSIAYPALQDASLAVPDETINAVEDSIQVTEQPKPKRGRKPKNTQDSTIIDDSVAEPVKKPTRGRKKVRDPSPPVNTSLDESQLQSELQEAAQVEPTHQSPPPRSGRGVKRTSDGAVKDSSLEDASVEDTSAKPKKSTKAAKGKKNKKAVKDEDVVEESIDVLQPVAKPKRTRSKKTKQVEPEPEPEPELEAESEEMGNPIPEGPIEVEPIADEELHQEILPDRQTEEEFEVQVDEDGPVEPNQEPEEDIGQEMDEQEELDQENLEPGIQAGADEEHEDESGQDQQEQEALEAEFNELENDEDVEDVLETRAEDDIEEEQDQQASLAPTPAAEEFEPTPTPELKRQSAVSRSSVRKSAAREQSPMEAAQSTNPTPNAKSPQLSDSENQPPSSTTYVPPTAQKISTNAENPALQPKEIFASPTKTVRVPLAASTPNRSPRRSPSKFGRLTTTLPWEPVDLEAVFFPDSENINGAGDDVFNKLLEVGGGLTSPEKKMTVEEWIRSRAELSEHNLKTECERMVMLFEKEGNRGLTALSGVRTS